MAATSVAPLFPSSAPSTNSSSAASSANLSQTDFLNLLTAQLQNQDPLNPMSGSDFTSQLAQFTQMSGIQQLNTTLTSMMTLQSITQAANLIGKTITYGSAGSQGTVASVQMVNGQPVLMVGGNSVTLDQVQGISS